MIFAPAESSDVRLRQLEERLAAFYAGNNGYYEDAEGDKEFIYRPLVRMLDEWRSRSTKPLRVLELGAGRTSFPAFLRESGHAEDIQFTAQDINETNVDFYRRESIPYVIGDWSKVRPLGPFDLCFSTYVFEHLVEPHEFLKGMAGNLTPDGSFVIICPKYICPGYVPPAIRWLPKWRQHYLTCLLALANIWTGIAKRPKFRICIDPAVFRLPWRRDSDAIHMVSPSDVKAAVPGGFEVRPFRLDHGDMRARIFNGLVLMSVIAHRKPASTAPRKVS